MDKYMHISTKKKIKRLELESSLLCISLQRALSVIEKKHLNDLTTEKDDIVYTDILETIASMQIHLRGMAEALDAHIDSII
jgi:hypothetical protein